jgi:type II secretory pathway pseudopilin PulG
MNSPRARRSGFTLLELLFGLGISMMVLAGAFQLLLGMTRAELRTDASASVTEECTHAYSNLTRDLRLVRFSPGDQPVWIEPLSLTEEGMEGPALTFLIPSGPDGTTLSEVKYCFYPEQGDLVRSLDEEPTRSYHLGTEGHAKFRLPPSSNSPDASLLVEISIHASEPRVGKGQHLTLQGVVPLVPEISRIHFPYWNE